MQGIGNDYVYVNAFEENIPDPARISKRISDRHFGVGADGLVLVLPSDKADLRMRMFNADGSEAEMCGNASRCVAKFAYDCGLVRKPELTLETGAGVKNIRLIFDAGEVWGATVDMGEPVLEPEKIPVLLSSAGPIIDAPLEIDGDTFKITPVSMGNPHAVLFIKNIASLDLPHIGPRFENHPMFPRRVNTEFVEVLSRKTIKMRVWERGAGETLACGTGACAAVVACVLNGLTDREVEVRLIGGELNIKWDQADNHVYMTGPAVTVFTGEYFY